MSRAASKLLSRVWMVVLPGLLVSGCGAMKAKRERGERLAKVKRIAVVTFIGKSSASPKSEVWRPFVVEARRGFEKACEGASSAVEFVPMETVAQDRVYRSLAGSAPPDTVCTPVEGLTYIRPEKGAALDCTSLAQSLGVDALLMVVLDFGAEAKDDGTFALTAEASGALVGPPDDPLWKATPSYEEPIAITVASHPKLVGAIQLKSIVAKPSAEQYAELMRIAAERHTKMPGRAGSSLADELIKSIRKARAKG